MNGKLEFRCSKCGKLLNGATLDYSQKWLCSKCAADQTDVFFCIVSAAAKSGLLIWTPA